MNSGKERMIGLGIIAVGLIILLGKLGGLLLFWDKTSGPC